MKNNFTSLRITGGELKNKEIKSPEDKHTHPMGSRERLALMNIIGPEIKGAEILDAFAGTGAIGIEALSRGAKHVTFVEKNHKVAEILKQNLKNLNLLEYTTVIEAPIEKIEGKTFDFVIADPPYDKIKGIELETFDKLAKMAKNRFILSHPGAFDPHAINANIHATKSYAASRVSVFTNN